MVVPTLLAAPDMSPYQGSDTYVYTARPTTRALSSHLGKLISPAPFRSVSASGPRAVYDVESDFVIELHSRDPVMHNLHFLRR